MKTAGIIAEYNPFHKGHEYHINMTRDLTGAEGIVAVLSGNFVQRGEAAVCDKYTRTQMALEGGADLVVELPCAYSAQSAEFFAKGGVGILEKIGCDYISFGMESEDLSELAEIADKIKNPDENFKILLSDALKEGMSYPKALSKALGTEVVDTPNNVLAIEYLKAIESLKPIGIRRRGSFHDQPGSASDVRQRLGKGENIEGLVPSYTFDILKGKKQPDKKVFERLVLYKLRTMTAEEISRLPDVTEGLENRIKEGALCCTTYDELCEYVKTKRYTMARIRRIFVNALLGITKDDLNKPPQYIRVLGMNETGMKILAELKGKTDIPIITKTADAQMCRMLEIDIMASDVYSLLMSNKAMTDYTNSPIIIKE